MVQQKYCIRFRLSHYTNTIFSLNIFYFTATAEVVTAVMADSIFKADTVVNEIIAHPKLKLFNHSFVFHDYRQLQWWLP